MSESLESASRPPVSRGAFDRLMAIREAEVNAARRMRAGDDYPDFFVEGSGPPWHERWPEVIRGGAEFSEERMLFVDRLRQDDYPDFFVEGSGPPWHERWPEVIKVDAADPGQRVRVLGRLKVIQAFLDAPRAQDR